MKEIFRSLKVFLIFTLLLGGVYPLFIFIACQSIMPYRANGSLIKQGDKIIGSELIAQGFAEERYFHSRPSTNNYDASNSGGSNFGPANAGFIEAVEKKTGKYGAVPADMVLSSASGLDPHISIENALLQLPRVARARKLAEQAVAELISKNTAPDLAGLWGKKGVNVLKLNIALDELCEKEIQNGKRK